MRNHEALQKAQKPCAETRLATGPAIFYSGSHKAQRPLRHSGSRHMKATRVRISAFGLLPFLMLATTDHAAAGGQRLWPDNFQARLEVLALIETLNAELLASPSATETLTEWCAAHHMSADPKIVAHREKVAAKPLSAEQRQELAIGPDEPVIYRHVDLACGDHVLSEADNWYVPSRLTTEMNTTLTTSDVPFGRVVRPLNPRRQTIAVSILWLPLPAGWETAPQPPAHSDQHLIIPPRLFEHRAVVTRADGKPIAEVEEHYTAEVLDFPSPQ